MAWKAEKLKNSRIQFALCPERDVHVGASGTACRSEWRWSMGDRQALL